MTQELKNKLIEFINDSVIAQDIEFKEGNIYVSHNIGDLSDAKQVFGDKVYSDGYLLGIVTADEYIQGMHMSKDEKEYLVDEFDATIKLSEL
jgi:hypothetical protein